MSNSKRYDFCHKCYKKNPKGAARCQYCNAGLYMDTPEMSNSTRYDFCDKCDRANPKGTRFCKYCHVNLYDSTVTDTGTKPYERSMTDAKIVE